MRTDIRKQQGFTLPELLITLAIGVALMTLGIGGFMAMAKTARADGGLAEAMGAIEYAREMAVSQRRNMQLVFTDPNTISIVRVNLTGDPTTTMKTVSLPGRVEFRTFPSVPDTRLLFGKPGVGGVSFGSKTPVMYTTDGSFLNSDGDITNGTLFLGVVNESVSARAITIFGATGALTAWIWDGRQWNER